MSKAVNNLVDIIRELVQQEVSKCGGTVLCQVKEKKDETHYDLSIVSDDNSILRNIANMTKFDLREGDYVYIYKINGQLNNSFICYKIVPYIESAI